MIKVRAHTCYLGRTGYAAHARSFFRELSKHVDLRVRNFTWDGNPDYLNDTDLSILDKITLADNEGRFADYALPYSFPNHDWKHKNFDDFEADVDIVLMDADHHYFYEDHTAKVKIAYTVWESTLIQENFFNQLLKFDYLWVATEWHKEMAVNQGYPEYRVFVVNEGVSEEFFEDPVISNNSPFKFMFFGRWDYRKAVPEIIGSFLKAFPTEEVELILSADNPFSVDGFNSTEERLAHYLFNDSRIKVKHFLSREEYVDYIRTGDVLITCARSEGWNIPLIEAMAAGTPVIYSDWGAQLEFAKGKGTPVKISKELPAKIGADLGYAGSIPGNYAEPDFEDLVEKLKDCYHNHISKKTDAVIAANEIRKNFSWEKVGIDGFNVLKQLIHTQTQDKRKDEIAIVLSHADTEEKVHLLKRNLVALKNQGFATLVSTHVPVNEDIEELADIVVYDKDNPVVYQKEYETLSSFIPVLLMSYTGFDLVYPFDFNHGFAALKLIKNGLAAALASDYQTSHFVNYDYVITNEKTLVKHREELENHDLVSYRWDASDSINSAFFSAKTKKLLDALLPYSTKESYFKFENKVILEEVLYEICKESQLTVSKLELSSAVEGNILNGFILPTFPYIKTKNGNVHLYLCREDCGGTYLFLMGVDYMDELTLKVIAGNSASQFKTKHGNAVFVEIPEETIVNGLKVKVPELNVEEFFDAGTKRASCKITEPSLIKQLSDSPIEPIIKVHYINGPYVEVLGEGDDTYKVEFIDSANDFLVFESNIKANHWVRCNRKYLVKWLIRVTNQRTGKVWEDRFDLKGKRVYVSIDSSALGDTLAWFPHISEFKKQYECEVIVSTFKNNLYRELYPELTLAEPGESVPGVYAAYQIGWYYDERNEPNMDHHPRDFRKIPMQATTADILGIDHFNLKARLTVPDGPSPYDTPYVCLGIHSTAQAKYWNNPEGWQEVTDYFLSKGWKVVVLSHEGDGYMGNHYPSGITQKVGEHSLENAMLHLKHCEMFVGLSSGLSWLSWTVGAPTTIIGGFSWPVTEVDDESVVRIFKGGVCNGCFNWSRLDAGDWNWCPAHKGTTRQFECTRSITGSDVTLEIEKYFVLGKSTKTDETIVQESYQMGMVQNHKEIINAARFVRSLGIKNFMEIGTDQGGTFAIWSKVAKEDGLRISLDLPHGDFGRDDYDVVKRDNYLISLGANVHMIHGDSHSVDAKKRVAEIIGDQKLDFLFIDGDHTYEGVKDDFEHYKQYVKLGGWIGFHDIKDTEFHRNANCRVDQLWAELKGEKIEYLETRPDFGAHYGGIGFIRV
jgi:autotransporter strand-loop-strand O-heptosyltransferase